MSRIYPNVYTAEEENSHRFYQLPKELFLNDRYKKLNSDAKVLYSILLDRKELSRTNGWVDANNQVFLLFTRDNLAEMMNVSRPTVIKAFKQLTDTGLVFEERQGLNKPNKIYIGRIIHEKTLQRNGSKESLQPDVKEFDAIDTDVIDTEINLLKEKRYPISENGACVLSFYSLAYKYYLDKDHPTVTEQQLKELEYKAEDITTEYDLDTEQIKWLVHYHFNNLPPTNDGKIFSFLNEGVIYRYLQTDDEE